MHHSRPLVAALLATLTAALTAPAVAGAAPSAEPVTEVLIQATRAWNGSPYTHYPEGQAELTMVRITLPPHTTLPWHVHPSPNVAYVVSGSLTLQSRDDGASRVIQGGDAIAEIVGGAHRGVTGDEPVVLLVAYSGAEGLPLSIPAESPAPSP
jgi:quercetin dioxygenase-like cupin family protein